MTKFYENQFNKLNSLLNNTDLETEDKPLNEESFEICINCNKRSIIQDNSSGFILCYLCGIIKDIIIE